MTDTDDWRAQFEKIGIESVRGMMAAHRYSAPVEIEAIKWLAEKDQEAQASTAAQRADDLAFMRASHSSAALANCLAVLANIIAITALATAIIAMIHSK